jgi:ADP-ribose pyrophosphatase YjhB (NUDIX family)
VPVAKASAGVNLAGTMRRVEDHHWPLEEEEYQHIYTRVPRLTVEIIVRDESGALYLTRRSVEPCKGKWHLPGGTVRFGEALLIAVRRVAMRELSIDVRKATNRGYIEYPSHYLSGLDSPVGLVFEVTDYSGNLAANAEASESGWFTKVPYDMHADQDAFLLEKGYLVV